MIPVSSTDLRAAGYDGETAILRIAFQNGAVYDYFNVPEAIYKGLMAASSKGRYLHANIRERYRYRRIL